MPAPVYFESSVFLAMLKGEAAVGPSIKATLRELKADKVKIYTSILTIQEVSVSSFKRGTIVTDNHSKVAKIARIQGITREMALTAAKYEAIAIEVATASGDKRRQQKTQGRLLASGYSRRARLLSLLRP